MYATTAPAPRQEATPGRARRACDRLRCWPTLAGLVIIAGCGALDLAMLRDGLDELDEGYFLEQATRVTQGQLPYRDFDALYTPGLLYLHAWLFDLMGGPDLLVPRLVSLVGRLALALGLFALGRQLVGARWAVLPPLMVLLGLDTIPGGWEPHPGWYSAAATGLLTLLIAHLPSVAPRRQTLWLALAGAATAIVFLFKQNAGVFALAAALNLLVVRGLDVSRPAVTWQVRTLQVVTVAVTLGLALWLTRPFLSLGVAVVVLSPLLAASIPALRTSVERNGQSLPQRLLPLIPFSLGFIGLSLLWLAPLVAALGGHLEPLAPFIGAIDQGNLYYPLELPSPETWFGNDLPNTAVLLAPEHFGARLAIVLPVLGAWAGAWILSKTPPGRAEWRLQWLLFAGALAFLTEYPRMDVYHLVWSAPLLLVVGSVALSRAPRWLAAAGLVFMLLAAAPGLYARASQYYTTDPDTGWPTRTWLLRLERPAMARGFRLDVLMAWQLRDLLDELDRSTAPGEAIFVYPSEPIVYVLADRPNPTRYSHVYPGLSAAAVEQLIATLEQAHVQTVVVSDAWVDYWHPNGRDPFLDTYLGTHFTEAQRFGVYRVLRRAAA